MNPAVKWTMIAALAGVAGAYFAVVVWRARTLARVLLRRGYAEKGFDEPQLTARLRVLGWVGLGLSLVGVAAATTRFGG